MASYVTFKVGAESAAVEITASVSETWPTGGIPIAPGANINNAINAQPAGTQFRFLAGVHNMTALLALKAGNRYIADDPLNKPIMRGTGTTGLAFADATIGNILLKGLMIEKFGAVGNINSSAAIDYSGGVDWQIQDSDIGYCKNVGVKWGPGWVIQDSYIHHNGRYAVQGGEHGGVKLLRRCEWSHNGRNDIVGVPPVNSNDKGGCKFAETSNITVEDLFTHHNQGTGLWWDIQNENGVARRIVTEDNTRSGVSLEVSYGPFLLEDITARRNGSDKRPGEGPELSVPAGILVVMTPDVIVNGFLVEDNRNGTTVRQWAHPQVTGEIGTLDPELCGNTNIIFENGTVTNCDEWDAGVQGPEQSNTQPTSNVHWNNVTFDPDAQFTSSLHIN